MTNLDRYKKDLAALLRRGLQLQNAMIVQLHPDGKTLFQKEYGDKAAEFFEGLPSFVRDYQSWYSESKALIKQLLPDRLSDFVRYYEKPKPRKDISFESYRIEDALQGLVVKGWDNERVVGPEGALKHFQQQLAIVESAKQRFESSLFDIRQLVQADFFDSELEAASELLKNKFLRAAGAVAGVVLEGHLAQVCQNHNLAIRKKSPAISDFNNALKEASVIDIPQWRYVQHLADIRNLCDHDKKTEPTVEQVHDLVAGVKKVTKTVF